MGVPIPHTTAIYLIKILICMCLWYSRPAHTQSRLHAQRTPAESTTVPSSFAVMAIWVFQSQDKVRVSPTYIGLTLVKLLCRDPQGLSCLISESSSLKTWSLLQYIHGIKMSTQKWRGFHYCWHPCTVGMHCNRWVKSTAKSSFDPSWMCNVHSYF